VSCSSLCDCVFHTQTGCGWLTRYLTNRLWEFRQIYNKDAVWEKSDLLVTFWGQKVKGQGHDETRCDPKSTLGILMVMYSNVSVTDDNLSGEVVLVDILLSRAIQFDIAT